MTSTPPLPPVPAPLPGWGMQKSPNTDDEELVKPQAERTQPFQPIETEKTEVEPGVFVISVTKVYQVKTVAAIMDVSPQAVNKYIKNGDLVAFMTRAGKRVSHVELTRFLTNFYNPPPRKYNLDQAMRARGLDPKDYE